jgi:hypothetical protein
MLWVKVYRYLLAGKNYVMKWWEELIINVIFLQLELQFFSSSPRFSISQATDLCIKRKLKMREARCLVDDLYRR